MFFNFFFLFTWLKTGPGTSPETFHIEMIDPNKPAEPQERRNSKNVALFADSFFK